MSDSAWVRLTRIGKAQHRQVSTQQLRAVGWDADAVNHRVGLGQLHPVYAEVYSLGGPPQADKERWKAATLTFGPGTKLSDSAAVELYGWLRYPIGEIHVTTTTERAPRDGIKTHHRTNSTDWRTIDRIPVTSPEQTILDCAGTLKNDKLFRRIIRQAQANKDTTHARLLLLSAKSAGVRGVTRLRTELAEGPAPTRSANEDQVRELLKNPGRIETNVMIGVDEVDVYLPEHRAVIEVQSELHANPASQKHDAEKKARLEARGLRVFALW